MHVIRVEEKNINTRASTQNVCQHNTLIRQHAKRRGITFDTDVGLTVWLNCILYQLHYYFSGAFEGYLSLK